MSIFVNLMDLLGLGLLALCGLLYADFKAGAAWKQHRCKHDGGVTETQACDAICRKCGKILGFIQTWHDAQKGRP